MLVLCAISLLQAGLLFAAGQDREDGLPGMPYRTPTDKEFKVCADPENMPYSNQKGEGFENKIAEVLAKAEKRFAALQKIEKRHAEAYQQVLETL